jgi:PAS domain S-box-containing protein
VGAVDELSALRRRYGVALRAGRMGTFEYDPDSGVVLWDEAFEQLIGAAPAPGPRGLRDYAERVHPEDLEGALSRARACAEGRLHSYEHEYRMVRSDGTELWVQTNVVRIRPPGGGIRLIGVCADITDRRRAEQAQAAAREAEREARLAAELSQRRLDLLAQVASLLESPPDLDSTLQRVAELATGVLAEWCVVELVEPEGRRRVAVTHRDPAMVRLAEETERRWPSRPDDPARLELLRSRTPLHIPLVDDAMLVAGAQDEEHLRVLRRFKLSSAVAVPVQSGGRALGILSLLGTDGRTLDAEDVELAVELGRRAGSAVERARLNAELERVATALQRALLPPALPTVPGVELAAAYEPAGVGAAVGGDFYDVVTTGADRWWVALGDVQGKGAEAAAVTGTIRHVLRAVVHDTVDPAEALERAQVALQQQSMDQRTASVVLATFRAGDGPLRVDLASAGHPPPLLRTSRAGEVAVQSVPTDGLLLGVGEHLGAATTSVELDRGDVLLLYTDGATDAPVPGGHRLEEEGLCAVVASAPPKPGAVVDAVLGAVRGSDGARRDDIALLALGRPA